MLRLTLHGRTPRVLRPDELARGVWSLAEQLGGEAAQCSLDLERLSASGAVLDRRACASIAELLLLLPSLLAEPAG